MLEAICCEWCDCCECREFARLAILAPVLGRYPIEGMEGYRSSERLELVRFGVALPLDWGVSLVRGLVRSLGNTKWWAYRYPLINFRTDEKQMLCNISRSMKSLSCLWKCRKAVELLVSSSQSLITWFTAVGSLTSQALRGNSLSVGLGLIHALTSPFSVTKQQSIDI
jgi:hypothetical protein